MLEQPFTFDSIKAEQIMTTNPKTISPDALAIEALDKMRNMI